MAQSLSRIVLHLVFSTKNRCDVIQQAVLSPLHAYLAGGCQAVGSAVIRVGGTSNHVHIACILPRTLTVSKLVEAIKTSSSSWMKTVPGGCPDFSWQTGYGAFSVGASQIDGLVHYIDQQGEHHRRRTFEEEFRGLLVRYGVEYDERYVWD